MSKGKCMRPGPITSNGYLNFLREYRQKNCGMTAVQTVRCGAKEWNKLSCKQKAKYRLMGCKGKGSSKKKKKKSGCRPKKKPRRKSGCGKKRRPKPKRKKGGCGKKRRPKPKRKKGGCGKKRRPKPKRRGGCAGKKKKRCMKPGPVTANAYLNFLRFFRRKNCGLKPTEAVKRGARKWCSMSKEQRMRFMRQACQMSKSKRRRKSALCRNLLKGGKKKRC